jgi:hypothetical protein
MAISGLAPIRSTGCLSRLTCYRSPLGLGRTDLAWRGDQGATLPRRDIRSVGARPGLASPAVRTRGLRRLANGEHDVRRSPPPA